MNGAKKNDEPLPAKDLGLRLRSAREAKGLTIEELADQMRLIPSVIKDLEECDYAKFDAIVYVTGYLRLYSKLVQIDERETLSLFYKDPINRVEKGLIKNKSSNHSSPRINPLLFAAVMGLAALLVGFLYLDR